MARDKFLTNLRNAASFLLPHRVTLLGSDSTKTAKRISRALDRASFWLTPKAVEGFDADDFSEVPEQTRNELSKAVRDFVSIARTVPGGAPASEEQVRQARPLLLRVIELVQSITLPEWLDALERLYSQIERWARDKDWSVKSDTKRVSELFFGSYEAPQLLVHAPQGRLLLEPVSRFAVGAEGLLELCVMPSFDSARISRKNDEWFIEPLRPLETRKRLTENAFFRTANHLFEAA